LYKIPASTLFVGQNLIFVPECHSTNSLLNDLNNQSALAEGTVVITNNQTAGRGQRGNKWEAEPGRNLTFSALLRPHFMNAKDQFRLNMAVSVAIADAFSKIFETRVKLKWPNDIFLNGKKMGGILIENQLQGPYISSSVIGIGLNINQKAFHHAGAVSLSMVSGREYDLGDVFRLVIEHIEAEYLDLKNGKTAILKQRYLSSLFRFREQQEFAVSGQNFKGVIHDVDEDGKLCVESGGTTRKFAFKEVSFVVEP
jgi:BirA family biotin operon repressor/biotin-[acetyl-CoA-carboxylase] ligase